jgi:hypothetical protein
MTATFGPIHVRSSFSNVCDEIYPFRPFPSYCISMNLSTIVGVVADLDRTTSISGGGNTSATTTHITLFHLMGERVLLESDTPAMIANGDRVRLAGIRSQGQFTAIACRNITTGWMTSAEEYGLNMLFFIIFGIFSIILTFEKPILFILPIFIGYYMYKNFGSVSHSKAAHDLLIREMD